MLNIIYIVLADCFEKRDYVFRGGFGKIKVILNIK